jgi:integrase
MSQSEPSKPKLWQKSQYANLIRYVPSGTYFARIRVAGKLVRRSLKTTKLSVAKLRLTDFERAERSAVESRESVTQGRVTMGEAAKIYLERVQGDPSLKPRTVEYHNTRLNALFRSWPGLDQVDVGRITKTQCLDWASSFGKKASPSAFNYTISVLRKLIEIGIESGARYDNPAQTIKRVRERAKIPQLPEPEVFNRFVDELENGHGRFSRHCADLVRFLAFGGFRIKEAKCVTWGDVDFDRGKIRVVGDPFTGTKNGEYREVPMIPEMIELLARIRESRSFEESDHSVMAVFECQKAMDRAAKEVAMMRITHHSLRHLFATRCIESGVDIPTVSRWLGHKDGGALAMRVYGHLRDEHSVAMAERVRFGA